jgi:hypothetical protein
MKKVLAIIFTLLTLFTLTACFGGEPTDTTTQTQGTPQSFKNFENKDFSIIYPENWEVLEEDSFTSNVPATTVVVFRNNIKSDIFTANLNVSQATILEGTTSEDFALQTLNTEKYNLVGFTELKRENYTLGEGENAIKTFLITFQGRKTITETLVEFKQLCIARSGFGIIVTAAYLPNEDQNVVYDLDQMVKAFTLKSL